MEARPAVRDIDSTDVQLLRTALYARVNDLKGLLYSDIAQARKVLGGLLQGRLSARPVTDGNGKKTLELEGVAGIGQLLMME